MHWLPPSKCKCRCITNCPPYFPLLMTNRYPFYSFYCLAILLAANTNFPKMASCRSSACSIMSRPSFYFGIMTMWTGACGLMSLNARIWSSYQTILAGIYFLMILSKIVSLLIFKDRYFNFYTFSRVINTLN